MRYDYVKAALCKQFSLPGGSVFRAEQFCLSKMLKRTCPLDHANVGKGAELVDFYDRLLFIFRKSILKTGEWYQLDCLPQDQDHKPLIAHLWKSEWGEKLMVVINMSASPAQVLVSIPSDHLSENAVRFTDLFGNVSFIEYTKTLVNYGLYVDLMPWQFHVFDMEAFTREYL